MRIPGLRTLGSIPTVIGKAVRNSVNDSLRRNHAQIVRAPLPERRPEIATQPSVSLYGTKLQIFENIQQSRAKRTLAPLAELLLQKEKECDDVVNTLNLEKKCSRDLDCRKFEDALELVGVTYKPNIAVGMTPNESIVAAMLRHATGFYDRKHIPAQVRAFAGDDGNTVSLVDPFALEAKVILMRAESYVKSQQHEHPCLTDTSKLLGTPVIDSDQRVDTVADPRVDAILNEIERRHGKRLGLVLVGAKAEVLHCSLNRDKDDLVTVYKPENANAAPLYRSEPEADCVFNPMCSREQDLAQKGFLGLVASRFANRLRPYRKDAFKMTNEDLWEWMSIDANTRKRDKASIEKQKEFGKRTRNTVDKKLHGANWLFDAVSRLGPALKNKFYFKNKYLDEKKYSSIGEINKELNATSPPASDTDKEKMRWALEVRKFEGQPLQALLDIGESNEYKKFSSGKKTRLNRAIRVAKFEAYRPANFAMPVLAPLPLGSMQDVKNIRADFDKIVAAIEASKNGANFKHKPFDPEVLMTVMEAMVDCQQMLGAGGAIHPEKVTGPLRALSERLVPGGEAPLATQAVIDGLKQVAERLEKLPETSRDPKHARHPTNPHYPEGERAFVDASLKEFGIDDVVRQRFAKAHEENYAAKAVMALDEARDLIDQLDLMELEEASQFEGGRSADVLELAHRHYEGQLNSTRDPSHAPRDANGQPGVSLDNQIEELQHIIDNPDPNDDVAYAERRIQELKLEKGRLVATRTDIVNKQKRISEVLLALSRKEQHEEIAKLIDDLITKLVANPPPVLDPALPAPNTALKGELEESLRQIDVAARALGLSP